MMNPLYLTPDDNLQKVFDQAAPGTTIFLSPGIYRQKTVVRTPGLTIIGQGPDKTILIYDDYARKRFPDGFEYLTFRSFTLAVCADSVTLRNLSVVNDAGAPERKGQQIALSVLGDRFRMENCHLRSTQDTLFAGPLPEDLIERYTGLFPEELRRGGELKQVYRNCLIEGTVDFIFGSGDALFESCELRSLVDARDLGFVAAPSHGKDQQAGFLFQNCHITCQAGVTPGSIYLARPWRDYGLCRFQNCTYGHHIAREGFDKWSGTERDRTARFFETPEPEGRAAWINR